MCLLFDSLTLFFLGDVDVLRSHWYGKGLWDPLALLMQMCHQLYAESEECCLKSALTQSGLLWLIWGLYATGARRLYQCNGSTHFLALRAHHMTVLSLVSLCHSHRQHCFLYCCPCGCKQVVYILNFKPSNQHQQHIMGLGDSMCRYKMLMKCNQLFDFCRGDGWMLRVAAFQIQNILVIELH